MKKHRLYNTYRNTQYILREALKVQKSIVVLCITTGLLMIIDHFSKIFFLPTIISSFEQGAKANQLITTITLFVFGIMIINTAQTYINANVIYGRIDFRCYFAFKVHNKLATTSYPNTENPDFREKLDQAGAAINGNEGALTKIWDIYAELIFNIFCLIINVILLFNVDGWLVGITIITSTIGYYFRRKSDMWVLFNKNHEVQLTRKITYIQNTLQGISIGKDIRVYNLKKWMQNVYRSDLVQFKNFTMHKEKNYVISECIKLIFLVIRNGLAYIYIINALFQGILPVASFLLYLGVVNTMDNLIEGFYDNMSKLNESYRDIAFVKEFLEYKEPFLFGDGENIVRSDTYEICLENVSYSYPGAAHNCIENVNLKIKSGEKIAIVGLNGAGKTTLIKLICGLIEPTKGRVLLNGKDIRIFNKEDYYKLFSAVFQDYSILAGTIASNVSQSSDNIDLTKVEECLIKSGLNNKILSFPQRYKTHLVKTVYDDAVELSGGETQKLLLARALYKDAPIFVLDEPTASLDPIAESNIYDMYCQLATKKTIIFISHRLSSTRFCDKILLLDQGKIIESGTHDELIYCNGKYYELYNIQVEYYKRGNLNDDI